MIKNGNMIAGMMGKKSNQIAKGTSGSVTVDPIERLNQKIAGRGMGGDGTAFKFKDPSGGRTIDSGMSGPERDRGMFRTPGVRRGDEPSDSVFRTPGGPGDGPPGPVFRTPGGPGDGPPGPVFRTPGGPGDGPPDGVRRTPGFPKPPRRSMMSKYGSK